MKTCSRAAYVEGVLAIHREQKRYELGADGSGDGCDCIGMGRGALHRAGVEDTPHMRGTNDAARSLDLNLQKIKNEKQLLPGDVVFKTRDKDDPDMKLPEKYRKGQPAYDPKWGETNFTHYGTVTSVNPLVITHMTSPTSKQDTKLGNWSYFGQLPWVKDEAEDEEMPDVRTAMVWAESGKTVKMRDKPSSLCRLYWDVPIGSQIIVMEPGTTWTQIIWNGRTGYMKSEFIRNAASTYAVIISGLDLKTAQKLCEEYENSTMEEEVG